MGECLAMLITVLAVLLQSSRISAQESTHATPVFGSAFKDWGPPRPVESEFKTYSQSVVLVFHNGQQISSTLTPSGHYPDITVNVTAFGHTFQLKMLKNRYLFSKTYIEKEVTPDGETYINTTDIFSHCYYTGSVSGFNSAAAVSTCKGVLGYFEFDNDTYNIEPLEGTIAGQHRVYRDSDSVIPPRHCGQSGLNDHEVMNMLHMYIRKKRSFNWPQDLDGQTKVVELYIANDVSQFAAMGNNTNTVITRTKNIVNIASTMYHPLGIYLVLVGVEVWTERSMIPVLQANASATLDAFTKYRETNINPLHPNDNAHLIIGQIVFAPSIIGLAYIMRMCSYGLSSAFDSDITAMPGMAAATLAHEMGHNFGFLHDDQIGSCSCDDPAGYCIMQSYIGNPHQSRWSQCSKDQLVVSYDRKVDYCLDNIPDTMYDQTAVCGNGIVETGEQCDCGNSTTTVCNSACCDPVTCRLVGPATCAYGRCCNLTTCQLKPLTAVCRPASESCDLAEYCSGVDAVCPSDVYRQDGTACTLNAVGAYCYQGRCNTHESQCQLLYGPTAQNSNINCYSTVNLGGDQYGHCGYNITTNIYTPCSASDTECGALFCDIHITSYAQLLRFDGATLSWTYFTNSTEAVLYYCTTATYRAANYGGQRQDPGLVPNGAACGTGKMCVSQKCVDVTALDVPVCPDCHQHGVCNNLGECHCDAGYAPPDCSQPGGGGSNHSNPIVLYEPPTTVTTTASSTITTTPVAVTSTSSPITTSSAGETSSATTSTDVVTSPSPITTSSAGATSSATTSTAAMTSSSPITTSSAAAMTSSSATTSSAAATSSSLNSSTVSTTTRPLAPAPVRTRPAKCAQKKWRRRHRARCT